MAEGKRLVVVKPLRYNRRDMVAGDVFHAATIDASYLMRTGKAKPADEMDLTPAGTSPAAVAPPDVPAAVAEVPAAPAPAEPPVAPAGSSQAATEDEAAGVGTNPAPRRRYVRGRATSWSVEPGSAE